MNKIIDYIGENNALVLGSVAIFVILALFIIYFLAWALITEIKNKKFPGPS